MVVCLFARARKKLSESTESTFSLWARNKHDLFESSNRKLIVDYPVLCSLIIEIEVWFCVLDPDDVCFRVTHLY